MTDNKPPIYVLKASLVQEISELLHERWFICDEDGDQDNDHEVIEASEKLDAAREQQDAIHNDRH